jgi:hypothetical protein
MSDRALDRSARLVYLCIEFLLPLKQLTALWLLERCYEARALMALVADPAPGSRYRFTRHHALMCRRYLDRISMLETLKGSGPATGSDASSRAPRRFAMAWPLNLVVLCFPDHSSCVSWQEQVGARKPSTSAVCSRTTAPLISSAAGRSFRWRP